MLLTLDRVAARNRYKDTLLLTCFNSINTMKNISLIEVTNSVGVVDNRLIKLNCLFLASINEGSFGNENKAQIYFDWVTSDKTIGECLCGNLSSTKEKPNPE